MHLVFGVSSKETDARPVVISCPICRKPEVKAVARDVTEKITLFHLVPVFVSKSTFVTCSCGALLLSSQKAAVLEGIDAAFGQRYIRVRVSPIARALVLGGVIAWLIPAIGLVWNGCGYLFARRYGGWLRSLSIVLLILSVLTTALLFIPTGSPVSEHRSRPTSR